MTNPVPTWVRRVTVAAVSVVAAVAAVVSYVHMHELADRAGEEWRAWIIPLSADGLLVAASMVMFVRRRSGEPAGLLPWVGLVLGLAASLAANLAIADWTSPISLAVSGWPPVALAVAFELLIMVSRQERSSASATRVPVTRSVGDEPGEGESGPAEQPRAAATKPRPRTSRKPAKRPQRTTQPAVDLAQLEQSARELVADGAGRGQLAKELSITPHQARQLLDRVRETNGAHL